MNNPNYKFDSWDFFNTEKKQENKKTFSKIISILKGFFIFFMIVIFFWGFGTFIFVNEVSNFNVTLFNGGEETKSLRLSGIFFELNTSYYPDLVFKRHVWHLHEGLLHEYDHYAIWNIGDVWNKSWSLFYVLFVFPVSWFLNQVMYGFGWAKENTNNIGPAIGGIFVTSFLLWLVTAYSSFKQQKNLRKKEKVQTEVDQIKKKYQNVTSFQEKQKMQMEIANLYKKKKISRFAELEGIAFSPLLLAMFVAVRSNRMLKDSGTQFFSFVDNIWDSFKNIGLRKEIWVYVFLILLRLIFFAIDSFLLPYLFKQKIKKTQIIEKNKQKKIQKFIMKWGFKILLIYVFFVFPIGTCIYTLFRTFFEICQKIFIAFWNNVKKNKEIAEKKGKKFILWNWKNFQIK